MSVRRQFADDTRGQRVRVSDSKVTHLVLAPYADTLDQTECGVAFMRVGLPLFRPVGTVTEDPIDCMACIARGVPS